MTIARACDVHVPTRVSVFSAALHGESLCPVLPSALLSLEQSVRPGHTACMLSRYYPSTRCIDMCPAPLCALSSQCAVQRLGQSHGPDACMLSVLTHRWLVGNSLSHVEQSTSEGTTGADASSSGQEASRVVLESVSTHTHTHTHTHTL